jgi:hypothetical protein
VSPADPRRSRVVAILAAALVVVAAATALAVAFLSPLGRSSSPEGDSGGPDRFAFETFVSHPIGAPFSLGPVAFEGDVTGKGWFRWVQRAKGTFGSASPIPDRDVSGTFESRRVKTTDPDRHVTRVQVEAVLHVTGAAEGKTLALRFDAGVADPLSRKEAVVRAPDDVRDAVEGLVALWTGRVPLPDREFRVGEAFPAKEVVDLEPMRRQMFMVFRYDTRGVAAVEGGARVVAVDGSKPDERAVVETLLRHRQEGTTSGPLEKPPTTSQVEVVVRAERRVALRDRDPIDATWAARRRIHVVGRGADYRVEVEISCALHESR